MHCPDYKTTGLRDGRKFLPPRCSPANKATGGRIISCRYMGATWLHWQVLKLHVCARCCPAAVTCSGRIPNCMRTRRLLTCCSGRISNCTHAAAVDLLQWQDTKLQWQDTKLQWQDTILQWQDTKLQWQDTKLHARGGCCPAAVAGYQTACAHGCPALNLLHRVKDEQTTTKQDVYPRRAG
jgi:hypothetical protein